MVALPYKQVDDRDYLLEESDVFFTLPKHCPSANGFPRDVVYRGLTVPVQLSPDGVEAAERHCPAYEFTPESPPIMAVR